VIFSLAPTGNEFIRGPGEEIGDIVIGPFDRTALTRIVLGPEAHYFLRGFLRFNVAGTGLGLRDTAITALRFFI
jgi:hypothetical protein